MNSKISKQGCPGCNLSPDTIKLVSQGIQLRMQIAQHHYMTHDFLIIRTHISKQFRL
jgi:hypothetical protein